LLLGAGMSKPPSPGHTTRSARIGNGIMRKWRERTAANDGHFVRHLDGDANNEDPSNIEFVHPFDAFVALHNGDEGAFVDWSAGLNDEEVEFVKEYAWNFCVTYQADNRVPQEPPIDRGDGNVQEYEAEQDAISAQFEAAFQDAMADPEVTRLVSEGDAAMESGDFDRAYELYAASKAARDALLPAVEGPGDMTLPSGAGPMDAEPRRPQHGRRSVERTSIVVSTPSRRLQPEGAPTKKDEVAARIAARNSAAGR